MITESIKEGFNVTHRNWQVILLKVTATFINLFGLLLFAGFSIAVVIAVVGADLPYLKDILHGLISDPLEILSKYLRLAILICVAFILYLTVASVIILYVFGGTLGVLRNSSLDTQYRFSFSSFFAEAKNLFFPLLWLFNIALLVIIGILIVFGILTVIGFSVIHTYSGSGTTLSTFVVSFFTLLAIFSGLIIVLGGLIFTFYAAIVLAVGKKGVIDSFRDTWNFLINKPTAFLFYIIVVIVMVAITIVLNVIAGSFSMIPMAGFIIGIPYRFAVSILMNYLSVVMWSSLLVFYIKGINLPVKTNNAFSSPGRSAQGGREPQRARRNSF